MYDATRGILNDGDTTRSNGGDYRRRQRGGHRFRNARRLHAAGVRVVITSTTERVHLRARELDADGEASCPLIADLTVETEVQRLVDSVLSRAGRIHILVNNAGMAQTGRSTESKPPAPDFVRMNGRTRFQLRCTRVSNDAPRLAGNDGTKIRSNCECDFGDGTAGEQRGLGGVWRGKGGDGWDDACRGDRDGGRWITINGVAPGWIATGSSTESERLRGCTRRPGAR